MIDMDENLKINMALTEIRGDIKLILDKLESLIEMKNDHEDRLRVLEKDSVEAKIKIGIIGAIGGIIGGLFISVLTLLIQRYLGG